MFQYGKVPLDGPRTIRLIKLQPSINGDKLRCNLETVSLDDSKNAVYDALSYVWGDPSRSGTIICNGQSLRITQSCEIALRRFRRRLQIRSIWVDAICINQDDKLEQGAQVKMMSDIYTCARLVLVWIGESDESSDQAFELLKYGVDMAVSSGSTGIFEETPTVVQTLRAKASLRVRGANMFAKTKMRQLRAKSDMSDARALIDGRDMGEDDHIKGVLSSIWALVERTWFQRMWTIQELINSRKAEVVCGKNKLPWDTVHTGLSQFMRLETTGFADQPMMIMYSAFIHLHDMIRMKRLMKEEPEEYGETEVDWTGAGMIFEYQFWRALRMLCYRESSNPVDRLYALRGCFEQAVGITLPDPDYSDLKPLSTKFREATVAIITHQKSLCILIMSFGSHADECLPSWAVDWTFSAPNLQPQIFPGYDTWQAAGKSASSYRFSTDGKTMFVAGKIVDTIRGICPGSSSMHELLRASFWTCGLAIRTVRSWLALSNMIELDWYTRGQHFMQLLRCDRDEPKGSTMDVKRGPSWAGWADIIFDRASCHKDEFEKQDMLENKQALVEMWKKILDTDDKETYDAPTDEENEKLLHLYAHEFALNEFVEDMLSGICDTSFFTTDNGRMGRTSQQLQPGDFVAVVAGVNLPLLLRKVDGGHITLGPAYVLGLMQGDSYTEDFNDWDKIALV